MAYQASSTGGAPPPGTTAEGCAKLLRQVEEYNARADACTAKLLRGREDLDARLPTMSRRERNRALRQLEKEERPEIAMLRDGVRTMREAKKFMGRVVAPTPVQSHTRTRGARPIVLASRAPRRTHDFERPTASIRCTQQRPVG